MRASILVLSVALSLLLAPSLAAQGSITLGVGDTVANIGDAAEVTVSLDSSAADPAAIIFFIQFDPLKLEPYADYYEIVSTVLGEPVVDNQGNTVTHLGPMRPAQAVLDAGKGVDVQTHPNAVAVAILGVNTTAIPEGALLTLAFRVLGGAQENETLALDAIPTGTSIEVNGQSVSSSAASNTDPSVAIAVLAVDGEIQVGCTAPPAPSGVAATQGQPAGVTVSWSGINVGGAEYRVYRSLTQNIAEASPIGDAWQLSTTYVDITALVPVVVDPGGCFGNPVLTMTNYYYWVKARNPQGCESELSAVPALGNRGQAKAVAESGKTAAVAFPSEAGGTGLVRALPDSQLALRLSADAPIAVGSVWGVVEAGGAVTDAVTWVPASEGAGWVTFTPSAQWIPGDLVSLTAGATTATGAPVGPLTQVFLVTDAAPSSVKTAGGTLVPVTDDALPYLPEGVGAVYRVAPEGVYETPLTVWLPVPEDVVADELVLYYCDGAQGARAWYRGEDVADWLLSGAQLREARGGRYFGFTLRHSGVVQLGTAPQEAAVTPGYASLASLPATPGDRGDAAVFLALAALLVLWPHRRRFLGES